MAKLIEKANDTRDFLKRTLGEMDSGEEVEEVLEERLEAEKAS